MAANAVALKLPVFWHTSPNTWFIQAEAQFALRNITIDETRYYHVVSSLDQDTARQLEDILAQPPTEGKYDNLKERLLRTFRLSESERAAKLLRLSGLGDRRPSQLMEEMLHLHQDKPICYLFKEIFLQQLPAAVRAHLSAEDFADPRQVALQADRLWSDFLQADKPFASAISHVPISPENTTSLLAPVSQRGKAHTLNSSPSVGPTSVARGQQSTLCFYHRKYGAKAHRCQGPCSWSGNGMAGRQ